jgi:hypothetical protein
MAEVRCCTMAEVRCCTMAEVQCTPVEPVAKRGAPLVGLTEGQQLGMTEPLVG